MTPFFELTVLGLLSRVLYEQTKDIRLAVLSSLLFFMAIGGVVMHLILSIRSLI